ncbi:MAG: hypothetical protein IJ509_03215 [Bacilli bacterium]|nr:hypothetical protein [Bacilli bacterium]
MSFKKLLGIISIVIVVMFSLMLTTSYAWYSFEEGSTTFDVVTNNDDIIVSYQKGEYISTNIAVPIVSDDVDRYAEKNNFSIKVRDNKDNNEILVSISLVDVSIDNLLQDSNFKVDLYHQNSKVASVSGDTIGATGATDIKLADVTLTDDINNNFELRVYILDDGTDQSAMMNKAFQGRIKIDVVSRLKSSINDYSNPDIYITSIMVDGEESKSLPVSGYYDMTASCSKGSVLSWEPLSKTITYDSGSYINDSCSLNFTKSNKYPLLSEMPVGSYVKYVGNNGCDGKNCEGYNANYKNSNKQGYCNSENYQFTTNGWRIGYVLDGSAYLVSAGAPECAVTYMDSRDNYKSARAVDGDYYYGSGYKFDAKTGTFTLTGVTDSLLTWSSNYRNIATRTPYTCKATTKDATCTTLYEIDSNDYSATKGYYYIHYNHDISDKSSNHLDKLDNVALKYCNQKYVKDGICDKTTVWAMDTIDFERITKNTLSTSSCYNKYSDKKCGYANDLIDNGGYYWFATSNDNDVFYWYPYNRFISSNVSSSSMGVRPVINLDNSVVVVGGAGTSTDPYVIDIK